MFRAQPLAMKNATVRWEEAVALPHFWLRLRTDWLHGNAVSYSRADGNLTVSLPEQDWVIKIDYQDGKGSGKILWRLGEGGDMKLQSSEKFPWFSYQHDAGFEPPGSDTLLLLDNGQRHKKRDAEAHTRGQLEDRRKGAHCYAGHERGLGCLFPIRRIRPTSEQWQFSLQHRRLVERRIFRGTLHRGHAGR
jgi:Arylsulfotransferase (ASST)